ncbi:MAG: hypothetical protein ACMVO3_25065 [Thalassobaculum sp.]
MEPSVKPPGQSNAPGRQSGAKAPVSSAMSAAQDAAIGALDLMIRHEIPPTPENYAVWYAYATGEVGTLRRTMDVLLTSGHGIDEMQIAELFERYVLPAYRARAVDDVAADLHTVTDGLCRSSGPGRERGDQFRPRALHRHDRPGHGRRRGRDPYPHRYTAA